MTRSEHESAGRMADLTRARAVAEAAEWACMLDYAVRRGTEVNAAELDEFTKQANISAIAMEIAVETGLSEHQVHRKLIAAERVRDHAPATWVAFRSGRVDAIRVQIIADAIAKLKRETSIIRLDQRVVAYASTHTVTELRRWLARFIARVEPDEHEARAEDEREQRRVAA